MAKVRKAKEEREDIPHLIERQYKSLFADQDTPPAPMNVREMEALKARVAVLEAELARQPEAGQADLIPARPEATPSEPVQAAPTEAPSKKPSVWRATLLSLGSGVVHGVREFGASRIQTRLTALILIVTLPILIGITAFISTWAES